MIMKKKIDLGDYALAKQSLPLRLFQPSIFLEQKLAIKYISLTPFMTLVLTCVCIVNFLMGLIWAHNIMTHISLSSHTFLQFLIWTCAMILFQLNFAASVVLNLLTFQVANLLHI